MRNNHFDKNVPLRLVLTAVTALGSFRGLPLRPLPPTLVPNNVVSVACPPGWYETFSGTEHVTGCHQIGIVDAPIPR